MRVLHLNTTWNLGGAAIACRRLHEGLLSGGMDSQVLCHLVEGGHERVHALPSLSSWTFRVRRRIASEARRLQIDGTVADLSLNCLRNSLSDAVQKIQPDIIHLHWVGGSFLRIEDLPRLRAPIVWTLHDMWPFCGAEHVSYSDVRWKEGYTRANRPNEARGIDLNRSVWRRKKKAWQGQTIHTIGVSTWIDQCVRDSALFRGINGIRRVIPNGLDESVFHPSRRGVESRQGKKIRLAFGAVKQSSVIKGGDLLAATLAKLRVSGMNLELVTFGAGRISSMVDGTVENWGRIPNPRDLAKLYNSVDLMIVPSRLESFGQTAAEAMACGTPVVCFDTSGLRDIVVHKETGYRARCYDIEDLAHGIRWCLEDPERLTRLGESASQRSLKHFRIRDVANRTINFYEEIICQP